MFDSMAHLTDGIQRMQSFIKMNNINEDVELHLKVVNAITKKMEEDMQKNRNKKFLLYLLGAIGIGLLDAILLAFIILNFCHIR